MNLVDRIKETANKRGMTLNDLSVKAGVGPKTISNWRNHNPQSATIQKVADVLGVSVDYLLGNTDEMHSAKKNPQDMNSVELEEALRGEGASLRFEGKELSDEYKRMILDILQNLK